MSPNKEMVEMLGSQTNHLEMKFYSCENTFFAGKRMDSYFCLSSYVFYVFGINMANNHHRENTSIIFAEPAKGPDT